MDDFPSNSNASKKPKTEAPAKKEKKVERVTTNPAAERKPTFGKRMASLMTGDDVQSVGQYLFLEVLIPSAKATITDLTSQGIERLLYGDSRGRSSSVRSGGRTAYHNVLTPNSKEPRALSGRARATHNFKEIVLQTKDEVDEVLDRLSDLIQEYGMATVADLYDLAGLTGAFTDDKYGWVSSRNFGFRRVREGYLLDLPRPEPLD